MLEIVPLPDADAEIVGSGDYDADGQHDILWRGGGNLFVWYLDDPANPEQETIGEISWEDEVAGSGDYDGDGTSDVLLRDKRWGNLEMYRVNLTSSPLLHRVDSSYYIRSSRLDDHVVVGSADFDGDGFCDIALRDTYSGDLMLLYMRRHQVAGDLSLGVSRSWSVDGVGLENPASD